ncbi:MAG: hypothetical protein IPP64_05285 [Bacteroidetes bacterium]|nr:hypothetical protein [Bacteroidota bacterium]
MLTNIRGIKVCYPSTGADLKGLMKAAYYDPNPVVMLEHKGLYWSKVNGRCKTIEPDEDYIIPFGKAHGAGSRNGKRKMEKWKMVHLPSHIIHHPSQSLLSEWACIGQKCSENFPY